MTSATAHRHNALYDQRKPSKARIVEVHAYWFFYGNPQRTFKPSSFAHLDRGTFNRYLRMKEYLGGKYGDLPLKQMTSLVPYTYGEWI